MKPVPEEERKLINTQAQMRQPVIPHASPQRLEEQLSVVIAAENLFPAIPARHDW